MNGTDGEKNATHGIDVYLVGFSFCVHRRHLALFGDGDNDIEIQRFE